jgi:hypothetical protein
MSSTRAARTTSGRRCSGDLQESSECHDRVRAFRVGDTTEESETNTPSGRTFSGDWKNDSAVRYWDAARREPKVEPTPGGSMKSFLPQEPIAHGAFDVASLKNQSPTARCKRAPSPTTSMRRTLTRAAPGGEPAPKAGWAREKGHRDREPEALRTSESYLTQVYTESMSESA